MPAAKLEHVNYTVSDIDRTAAMLDTLYGWKLRWRGGAINGGESAHVGTEDRMSPSTTPTARSTRRTPATKPRAA